MEKGVDFTGVTIVFFCHDGQGNFLLSKRSQNCRDERGRWDPGAGALKLHEKVEDALKREIKEEYGTEVLTNEFLGYLDLHRSNDGEQTHWIALVFKVLVNKSQVRNCEPHKFDDLQWFTLDKLPEPLHSQFPYALNKFESKLRKRV